jgi:hypothetical protein
LRGPAQGRVELPGLEIPGLEEAIDQPQEATVTDLLRERRQQNLVVQLVERPSIFLPPSITRTTPIRSR